MVAKFEIFIQAFQVEKKNFGKRNQVIMARIFLRVVSTSKTNNIK